MPTIMTAAEADYIAAYNDYSLARVGLYAKTVTAEEFIRLRRAMEDAMHIWQNEVLA